MNDIESCGKAADISSLTLNIISVSVVDLYHTIPVPSVSTSAQYGAIMGYESGNLSGVKSLVERFSNVMKPLFLIYRKKIVIISIYIELMIIVWIKCGS